MGRLTTRAMGILLRERQPRGPRTGARIFAPACDWGRGRHTFGERYARIGARAVLPPGTLRGARGSRSTRREAAMGLVRVYTGGQADAVEVVSWYAPRQAVCEPNPDGTFSVWRRLPILTLSARAYRMARRREKSQRPTAQTPAHYHSVAECIVARYRGDDAYLYG